MCFPLTLSNIWFTRFYYPLSVRELRLISFSDKLQRSPSREYPCSPCFSHSHTRIVHQIGFSDTDFFRSFPRRPKTGKKGNGPYSMQQGSSGYVLGKNCRKDLSGLGSSLAFEKLQNFRSFLENRKKPACLPPHKTASSVQRQNDTPPHRPLNNHPLKSQWLVHLNWSLLISFL